MELRGGGKEGGGRGGGGGGGGRILVSHYSIALQSQFKFEAETDVPLLDKERKVNPWPRQCYHLARSCSSCYFVVILLLFCCLVCCNFAVVFYWVICLL